MSPAPKNKIIVAPSILSADLLSLGSELKSVEAAGADWHHIDVMDGHFVPNLSFGLPLISQIKKQSPLPLDVHIMVSNPDAVAVSYVDAGADRLSFHVEVAKHPHRIMQEIQSRGAKAGLAINPGTSLTTIEPLLDQIDFILVMSVNPGFGGQRFLTNSLKRISELRQRLQLLGRDGEVDLCVDGGISDQTIGQVALAGANAFVAGSFVYGAPDRAAAIAKLRQLALKP